MSEAAKMLVQLTADDLKALIKQAVAEGKAENTNALALPPSISSDQKMLSLAEASKVYGKSVPALRKAMERGQLRSDSPPRPGFRHHRFLRSTLDAYMLVHGDK